MKNFPPLPSPDHLKINGILKTNGFRPFLLSPGKIQAANPTSLLLQEEHLNLPIVISGGSGGGKTSLLRLITRQLVSQGVGFTSIDAHGDATDANVQDMAVAGVDPARVNYLRPGGKPCPRIDPFDGAPAHLSLTDYANWLAARVEMVISAVLRHMDAASQDLVKRLKNWMRVVMTACGLDVDGWHLGLNNAQVLMQPQSPDFARVMQRIGPKLEKINPHAFYKLSTLQNTRSDTLRDKWTESSENAWADLLSTPTVRMLFGQHAPASVSMRDAILKSKHQLVNLRRSDGFSPEAGKTVGGFLTSLLIRTAQGLADELSEEERVPHYLIVDEAENFIGEDVRMGFAELRKYKLRMILAFQDINCLMKGDLDLLSKAFGNAGLVLAFAQSDNESIEYLGKKFAYGALDFTPLLLEQVLPDGYLMVPTRTLTVSANETVSASEAESITRTHSTTRQHHTAESISRSVSVALSESESEGKAHAESNGTSQGTSATMSSSDTDARSKSTAVTDWRRETLSNGQSSSQTNGASEGTMQQTTNTVSDTRNWSRSNGVTLTQGQTVGTTHGTSEGKSNGESRGNTSTVGQTKGNGVSVSYGVTPLPMQRIVRHLTGNLMMSVNDQLAAVMNTLASLQDRYVLVKGRKLATPFVLKVHDVIDPYEAKGLWRSKEWKAEDARRYLERVYAAHDFYFLPSLEAEREWLEDYLAMRLVPPDGRSCVGFLVNDNQPASENPLA